jgi:hypothetical protein
LFPILLEVDELSDYEFAIPWYLHVLLLSFLKHGIIMLLSVDSKVSLLLHEGQHRLHSRNKMRKVDIDSVK